MFQGIKVDTPIQYIKLNPVISLPFASFPDNGTNFWIDLNDLEQEGHYVWENTGNTPHFTMWRSSSPDNWLDGEDCMHIGKESESLWNDCGCHMLEFFICESEIRGYQARYPYWALSSWFLKINKSNTTVCNRVCKIRCAFEKKGKKTGCSGSRMYAWAFWFKW